MGPVLKPSWYVNPRESNFDSIVSISPSRYKFLGCCTTLTKWVDIWWYVSAAITPPLQYHGAPLLLTDILSYMNLTFTLCFTVECILKLISYGPGVNLTLFVAVFLSLCQCVKTVFTCQCIHICVSFSHQIFPMCRSWPAPLVKNKKMSIETDQKVHSGCSVLYLFLTKSAEAHWSLSNSAVTWKECLKTSSISQKLLQAFALVLSLLMRAGWNKMCQRQNNSCQCIHSMCWHCNIFSYQKSNLRTKVYSFLYDWVSFCSHWYHERKAKVCNNFGEIEEDLGQFYTYYWLEMWPIIICWVWQA